MAKRCRHRPPEFRHLPRTEEQQDWGPWEFLPKESMQEALAEIFGEGKKFFPHAEIIWVNKVYVVIGARLEAHPWGQMVHLYIFRRDAKPVRSWLDLQQIKNEIVDPQATAVEVFPPEDEKVDEMNWYHLWVLPPGRRLPFWMGNARPKDVSYYIPGIMVESEEVLDGTLKIKTCDQLPEEGPDEP